MKNLSISNSRLATLPATEQKPAREAYHWITSLVWALGCAVILLAGYEWSLRASGAEPNFRDNQARWSAVRYAAGQDQSSDAIALLGASRMRSSIVLSELEARYPDQAVYPLGYVSRNPCGVLQDLARSTEFRGTIVLSLNANWVDCRPGPHQMHRTVERYHQEWNWARRLDSWAADRITAGFVFTDTKYSIRSVLKNLLERGVPLPPEALEYTRQNRQIEFDYSHASDQDLANMQATNRRWFLGRVRDASGGLSEHWETGIDELSQTIETITARGGQVVIVRLPTSGALRRSELDHFPRAQFWDDLAQRLPASAMIHFEDYSQLSDFELPDDSHLDRRDAARFTAVLFDIFEQEGIDFQRR